MKTTMTRRTPAKTRIRNFFGHRSILRVSSSHNLSEYKQVATRPRRTMHGTPRYGDNVIADLDYQGNLIRSYVTAHIDGNISTTDGAGVTSYYNQDERWSVVNLTDSTGTVINDYAYSAYGDKVDALTGGSVDQRYTYTGRELSDTTENYYFRYRGYSAGTGSFMSRDPKKYINGMSLYLAYFAMRLGRDPFGLEDRLRHSIRGCRFNECYGISIGNDVAGGRDDFRTHYTYIEYLKKSESGTAASFLTIEHNIFTFRSEDELASGYRFDSLKIRAGGVSSFCDTDISIFAGIDLQGNYGGEWAQNTFHDLIGSSEVNLPYSDPQFGGLLGGSLLHHWADTETVKLNGLMTIEGSTLGSLEAQAGGSATAGIGGSFSFQADALLISRYGGDENMYGDNFHASLGVGINWSTEPGDLSVGIIFNADGTGTTYFTAGWTGKW